MAVITIDIDPEFSLGPLTLAWHGLMIARRPRCRWLARLRVCPRAWPSRGEILNLAVVIAVAGIVGARGLYLPENDAAGLVQPTDWFGTRGFSFNGAFLLGVPAAALYLRWRGLGPRYLDALAAGFPLGMAVGRIGDVINGEH